VLKDAQKFRAAFEEAKKMMERLQSNSTGTSSFSSKLSWAELF